MKEYRVLLYNGLILIIVSLIGYFLSPVKSPTAFIGAAFGMVFIFLSFPVKGESAVSAHIAVILMLIAAVAFSIRATGGNIYIIIMTATTIISLILLVAGFIRRKKERKNLNS